MNAPPVRLRLPRQQRLQRTWEFQDLRANGQRRVQGCLVANWLKLAPGSAPRVGVIVNRRIGPAVARTRARRLLREVFRLHQHDFRQPVAIVLVARASIAGRSRAEVERDFLAALRAGRLIHETA